MKIIFSITNIYALISFYKVSTEYKDFIDDNLETIYCNMIESIKYNYEIMKYISYQFEDYALCRDEPPYSFGSFVEIYFETFNYYVYTNPDDCRDDAYIPSYIEALSRRELDQAQLFIDKINSLCDNYNVPSFYYVHIPINFILDLIEKVHGFTSRNQISDIVVGVLNYNASNSNITEDQLPYYSQLLTLYCNDQCLAVTVDCSILFKLVYDTIIANNIDISNTDMYFKFTFGMKLEKINLVYESIRLVFGHNDDNHLQWLNITLYFRATLTPNNSLRSIRKFIKIAHDFRIPILLCYNH